MAYITVVIPLYNKESHIKDTLRSVLNQTFGDFEIIIVNDGSTDRSLEFAKEIKDERITVFSIENQGVSYARNYGIKKAKSELIVFLDADDSWKSYHLEHLKNLFEKFPNCGLYCTAYSMNYDGKELKAIYHKIPNTENWTGVIEDFFESSIINCIAWTSAVMIPKHIFEKIGYFDENITLGAGEDTDLWIRIALKFPVAFFNTVSAVHHMEADNRISKSNTNLRNFINLDKYESKAKTDKNLKIFLDLNRYSIAIQYKLAGDADKAKSYIKKIELSNLNSKQRFLLQMNSSTLKHFVQFKNLLRKNGIGLSAFR